MRQTVDGQKEQWCGKCNRWTCGKWLHKTAKCRPNNRSNGSGDGGGTNNGGSAHTATDDANKSKANEPGSATKKDDGANDDGKSKKKGSFAGYAGVVGNFY